MIQVFVVALLAIYRCIFFTTCLVIGFTCGLERGGCTGREGDFCTGKARARSSVSSEKNKPHSWIMLVQCVYYVGSIVYLQAHEYN